MRNWAAWAVVVVMALVLVGSLVGVATHTVEVNVASLMLGVLGLLLLLVARGLRARRRDDESASR